MHSFVCKIHFYAHKKPVLLATCMGGQAGMRKHFLYTQACMHEARRLLLVVLTRIPNMLDVHACMSLYK